MVGTGSEEGLSWQNAAVAKPVMADLICHPADQRSETE
jgi:hypothetical protein